MVRNGGIIGKLMYTYPTKFNQNQSLYQKLGPICTVLCKDVSYILRTQSADLKETRFETVTKTPIICRYCYVGVI